MKCKDCGTTWEQSRCPECAIGGRGIGGIETTTPKDQLVIDAAREWVAASDAFILADCKEKSAETLVVDERHRPQTLTRLCLIGAMLGAAPRRIRRRRGAGCSRPRWCLSRR